MANLLSEVEVIEGKDSYIAYIYDESAHAKIGNLENLTTTNKSNVVSAINELVTADDSLSNRITAEANTRESVDNALGTRITEEASTRESVDNALGTRITEEASTRESVDNALGSRISIETLRHVNYRNFLIVSDSYSDEDGEWTSIVPELLNIESNKWHNESVGGSGFVSNGTLLFINQITNYTGNKSDITDIIILGGLNDSQSDTISDSFWTTLRTNMKAFNTYARANYPNAIISLGFVGNGDDSASAMGNRTFTKRQLCSYFYNNIGSELGWKIIPNIEYVLSYNSVLIDSDGVHPSTAGSSAIAMGMTQYILNGTCELCYPEYSPFASGVYTGNLGCKYSVKNGRGHLHTDNWYMNISGATTLPSSFQIATLGALKFNRGLSVPVTLDLRYFDTLSDVYVPARLLFARDTLYLQILDRNTHSSNTDGGIIYINDFDVDFPIEYCM